MRPRVLSLSSRATFQSHEKWLQERLEWELKLDGAEAKYYARFVLSSLIERDEIDPYREKQLFVYSKLGPNSNDDGTFFEHCDTRSAEEISIFELHRASQVPLDHVTKLVAKLRRRIDLPKRTRINSETSELSAVSSQCSTSSYEAEFPELPTREAALPSDESDTKSSHWIRRKSSEKPFRFAFKNPSKSRSSGNVSCSSPVSASFSRRTNQKINPNSNAKQKLQKIPRGPENIVSQKQTQDHKTASSCNVMQAKDKRKRKRNRKKKKKSNAEPTSEFRNVATYENFDHFSMDQALNFVQNLSGQSDDVDIWTNVVKEQHVKYLNGTFFFTPRETSDKLHAEGKQSYKTKFFIEGETGFDPVPIPCPVARSSEDKSLSNAQSIANRMAEIIIDESPDERDEFHPQSTRDPTVQPSTTKGVATTPQQCTWPVLSDAKLSPRIPLEFNPWTIW